MDLTRPWHSGDVTFIVEGRKIHANKGVLGMYSEVFRAMFTSKSKERKMTEIPLREKKFDDLLAFIQTLHPLPKPFVDDLQNPKTSFINIDFTQPWHSSDVTFIVERKKIYANKGVLGMYSDVFRAMFTTKFKQKEKTEIVLPDKTFDDFLVFLQTMHPPPNICVDDTNVESLLHLAHEYEIHHVIERCEKALMKQPPSIHNLILADKFSLPELRQVFFDYLKSHPHNNLEGNPEFEMVDKDTRIEVIERHSLHQQPSIESMLLAEKYAVPEVLGKCLKYLQDTPLSKLKTDPGFTNLKPETLIQVLMYKAEQIETLKAEVGYITKWGVLDQQDECTGTLYQPQDGSVSSITDDSPPVQHPKGSMRTCNTCSQHRITQIGNVIKKY